MKRETCWAVSNGLSSRHIVGECLCSGLIGEPALGLVSLRVKSNARFLWIRGGEATT